MRDSGGYGPSGFGPSDYGSAAGQSGYGRPEGQPGYDASGYDTQEYGPVGYGAQGYGSSGYGSSGYGPGGYGPPPPRRRGAGVLSHLAVAVVVAAASVGVTLAVHHPRSSGSASAASSPNTSVSGAGAVPSPASSGGTGTAASEQQVVNKVEPGIVVISTTLQYDSEAAEGTGMVINSDGLVLTNNHVIEGSTKITARVVATGQTYPVTVVGYDKTQDVALVQLTGASHLSTVPVGNSASLKAGEKVLAMGNAEGVGTIIPAGGSVTGLDKTITASDQGGNVTSETLHGMIETNAGIVSGDSGGPLSTLAGQVIGMDTAANSSTSGFSQQQSTGFAIPINTALSLARQIAAGHASSTIAIGYPSFMGVFTDGGSSSNPQIQAEQQEQASGFGGFGGFGGFFGGGTPSCYQNDADVTVPSSVAQVGHGTLVDGVICATPAARAGMTAGSVITAIDGHAVGAPASLTGTLAKYGPGATISVSWVSPAGQSSTSSIRLASGPPQ
jgi:S1-C subfamily serine protease